MTKKEELIKALQEAKHTAENSLEERGFEDKAINGAEAISYEYAIKLAERIL